MPIVIAMAKMLEYGKNLDSNKYVLQWDLKERNGIKTDIDEIRPGTKEYEIMQQCKLDYTAFCNMLRYTQAMTDTNFRHSVTETIKWDLDVQYGFTHTPSLTAQLYKERAAEIKKLKAHRGVYAF